MRQSEHDNPPSQSIDISQWRQDINTFVHELQGELSGMIDELSNNLSTVERHTYSGNVHSQPHEEFSIRRHDESGSSGNIAGDYTQTG